jgi:hypothetical protein
VTRDGIEERHDDERLEHTVFWKVHIDAGARADVLDMSRGPATTPRCEGGDRALDLSVDDAEPLHGVWFPGTLDTPERQVHWERPIVLRGEHVITGRFADDEDEDQELLASPSVVDVALVLHDVSGDRKVCVRVPASGPGVVLRDEAKWSVGGRLSWRRALAFSNSSTLAAGLAVGRWVGPVRIGLAGTVGGADTSTDGARGTSRCFISAGPDCDDIFFGTAALEAGGLAWRWGRLGLGWSASYETIFASITPASASAHQAPLMHAISGGARFGLQLLRTSSIIPGAERAGPTSAWGVELFAAQATELLGAARGVPLTFGASLLWF